MMYRKKRNKGFFGALIFSVIGFIPWIVYYLIFDKSLSIYGIAIPFFAYKGYRVFNGEDKENQLIIYIFISSILSLINCYITMPLIYLKRNSNLESLESYLETFRWIETRNELFHNYLYLISFVVIGVIILYVIYIPYLVTKKEEEKNKIEDIQIPSSFLKFFKEEQEIEDKTINKLIKPIIISVVIVLISILIVIPKKDRVKFNEETNTKHVTNECITYSIPNEYSIYKSDEYQWVIMKLNGNDENDSGITIDVHTILEDYQSIDLLVDSLYKGLSNDQEVSDNFFTIKKDNITLNGYKYIEMSIENYRGATHIIHYVIDEDFEYCAIVECACYENDNEILKAFDQITNSIEFIIGKE